MKGMAAVLTLSLALSLPAFATPASEATIDRLIALTHADRLSESMMAAMEPMMRSAARDAAGKDFSAEQQRQLDDVVARLAATFREEFAWSKMRPDFVRLYGETFSEEELQAAIAFYETPAGQALLSKMPALMQRSMAMTQERMKTIMPRVRSEMEAVVAESRKAK